MSLILMLALFLRLYGLDWDEGYAWTPHPDERAILSRVVELSPPGLDDLSILLDASQSPWNPRWFPYGSFPLYLLKIVDTLSHLVPGLAIDDLRAPGRIVSALADSAAIVFVYLLGSAVWSRRVGVLSAGLVSLAVIHIQLSHFFAVDTLLALLTVASLFFLVRVALRGRLLDSALAGLCIGLALATKVSVAPIFAAYLVAHIIYAFGVVPDETGPATSVFDRMGPTIRAGVIGIAVTAVVVLIAQPYSVLDWDRFYGDFVEQSEMVRRIRDYPYTRQYIDTTPYLYNAQQLAAWGLGWPLGLAVWAGVLYAAVRGMRVLHVAVYLLGGIALPASLLLLSSSLTTTLIASAIAVAALIITVPVRAPNTRINVMLLSWVVPYFLIVGAFDVKFMRYLIPITPVLLLFASRMILDIWNWAGGRNAAVRTAVIALLTAGAVATGFYGVSYAGIYSQPHPAVRAADWIRSNAPAGSLVLKEHWEEGLPGLYDYRIEEMPIYDPDRPAKTDRMSRMLAQGDYLVLYSNRLYGTVARLRERYPVSREYYRQLFDGGLGYTLVASFTSYPNLLGVEFVDETFTRPDLPSLNAQVEGRDRLVSLNLGYADESFSVYDHPKVLVFSNAERLESAEIARQIFDGSGGYPVAKLAPVTEVSDPGRQLMLTPAEAAVRRAGGTWSRIVSTGGLPERAPIFVWLLAVEIIALVSVPLSFIVFRPFADRGWLMSKALGLLIVGLGAWLLASLGLAAFSRASILGVVLAVAAFNTVLLIINRDSIFRFLRRQWKTVTVAELIFLAAFLALVLIRMANPDLWHPWRGGEKPMDFAYLNAVLKSVYMPPYDPWFAGGYINYYYWGQFLVAALVHLTGIVPEVAVNLAVPTFFAMTAALSYSVVFNLASRVGAILPRTPVPDRTQTTDVLPGTPGPDPLRCAGLPLGAPEPEQTLSADVLPGTHGPDPLRCAELPLRAPDPEETRSADVLLGTSNPDPLRDTGLPLTAPDPEETRKAESYPPGPRLEAGTTRLSPVLAGLTGILFVVVIGNLDGAIQLGQAGWRALVQGLPAGEFDFWRSSRMMPPDPPGYEITEFPFFTFLFADPHAHLWALPFTLLCIGLSASLLLGLRNRAPLASVWSPGHLVTIAVIGVSTGALRLLNTWDYPTYLLFGFAAIALTEYLRQGGLSGRVILRSATKSALVFAIGYLFFLPFHQTGETFFIGVESTTNRTPLWQFLAIFGLFIFVIGSHYLWQLRNELRATWSAVRQGSDSVTGILSGRMQTDTPSVSGIPIGPSLILMAVSLAVLLGFALTALLTGSGLGTVIFSGILLAVIAFVSLKALAVPDRQTPVAAFVALTAGTALAIVIGLDFVRVEGDIERMNSVFKFYLQAWVLMALAAAYLTWHIAAGSRSVQKLGRKYRRLWAAGLFVLVLSCAVFPILGTQDRLRDRFDGNVTPLSLNGLDYASGTVYQDLRGPIDLTADLEGIHWLRANVQGSPVILEANTPLYRWGGRVSVYTGLPSVVGWQWHQQQQRWDYRNEVDNRIRDVRRIYSGVDPVETIELLREYQVRYIYVGEVERLYYPSFGIAKFETSLKPHLRTVFQTDAVTIYELR